jgi:hypothetical protein
MNFTHDSKDIKVGQDVRVEYKIDDTHSIFVILTHEGVIIDYYKDGELMSTEAEFYADIAERMSELAEIEGPFDDE